MLLVELAVKYHENNKKEGPMDPNYNDDGINLNDQKNFFTFYFSTLGVIVFTAIVMATIVLCAMSTPINAQVGVGQRAWQYGTVVTVWNDTADQNPLNVFVDGGRATKLALRHGERWSRSFGSGAFLFYPAYYTAEVNISAQVCEETRKNQFVITPPEWASDETMLGSLALTHEYLLSSPSESEIKERVKEIKKVIRGRIGHKTMKRELNEWLAVIQKTGLSFQGETCVGPTIRGAKLQLYGNSYNNERRSITIYIRGDREHGYRLEGPDGNVY